LKRRSSTVMVAYGRRRWAQARTPCVAKPGSSQGRKEIVRTHWMMSCPAGSNQPGRLRHFFDRLVTPTGSKVACGGEDLARWQATSPTGAEALKLYRATASCARLPCPITRKRPIRDLYDVLAQPSRLRALRGDEDGLLPSSRQRAGSEACPSPVAGGFGDDDVMPSPVGLRIMGGVAFRSEPEGSGIDLHLAIRCPAGLDLALEASRRRLSSVVTACRRPSLAYRRRQRRRMPCAKPSSSRSNGPCGWYVVHDIPSARWKQACQPR